MKSVWYRDTRVSKSSELGQALEAGDQKLAAKLYEQSNAVFNKTYPQCNAEWFQRMNGKGQP
ncbi:hypothetical protein [Cupriavidus metallidurans]|uniref:hypothetical protein n=1 Tax=Cupriavidus metallidurans TaxID=119219 RepID=UPI001CCF05C3|nr:hypothetical protein [Cupriavidus metallidurans]UBM12824.1 hypothetical protein LAI70_28125 [Cupriavidus metallidurans]